MTDNTGFCVSTKFNRNVRLDCITNATAAPLVSSKPAESVQLLKTYPVPAVARVE